MSDTPSPKPHPFAPLPLWLRAIHCAIIGWLSLEATYATWQIFYELQPQGIVGPMFVHAKTLGFEAMTVRRLYAIEAWISFGSLAIYLAITEVLPRRLRG